MLIDKSSPQGTSPEAYLSLLQTVGRILADAPSLEDALDRIIRAVCATLHWDYGARWQEDEQTHLFACTQMWHAPFLDNTAFVEMIRSTSFMPGPEGLLRTVLKTRQPFLVEDTSAAPGLRRAQAAMEAGLRSAFAFPLLSLTSERRNSTKIRLPLRSYSRISPCHSPFSAVTSRDP